MGGILMRRISAFLIVFVLLITLVIQPGSVFAGSEDSGFSGDSEYGFEEPGAAGGDGSPAGNEGDPVQPEGGEGSEGPEPAAEGEEGGDGGLLDPLEAIEDLTAEPEPGAGFYGYVVVVKEEEVTDEMIDAAPNDLIAGRLFAVDTPEEALDFADPEQIVAIEPNYLIEAFTFAPPPDDDDYSGQWGLHGLNGVNAEDAWDLGLSGAGVRVAVIDTGIYYSHPDFNTLTEGYAFDSGNGNYLGSGMPLVAPSISGVNLGHGTFVSSIIGAQTNNSLNIAGLAYGSEIVTFKVMNTGMANTFLGLIRALEYIAANNSTLGIDVINISLGGASVGAYLTDLQNAITSLIAQGVIIVAAVGNDNVTTPMYPAACPGVIGVGATDYNGDRWVSSPSSGSQYNASVDVAAPGAAMSGLSYYDGSTVYGTGTSYASPMVAGAAAMVKEADPAITQAGFLQILEDTSVEKGPGKSPEYGFGILDVGAISAIYTYETKYAYDGLYDENFTVVNYAPRAPPLTLSLATVPFQPRTDYIFAGYILNGTPVTGSVVVSPGDLLVLNYVHYTNLELNYRVEYEYGGVVDPARTIIQKVRAIDPIVRVSDITQKPQKGFEFDTISPALPYVVTEGETITVRYINVPFFEDGSWHWYDPGGSAKTGWVENNGNWFYFDPVTGASAIGLTEVPGISGVTATMANRQCFFDTVTGYVYKGVVKLGSYYYYFDGPEGMLTSTPVGSPVEPGDGKKYYLDENGRALTGWQNGKYYDENGMALGAKKIGSYWYWFDKTTGSLNTTLGLVEDDSDPSDIKYYYCYNAKGYLRTGKFTAKFDAAAGVSMSDPWYSAVNKNYYADPKTAALLTGQVKLSGAFYYYDAPYGMLKNVERRGPDGNLWFYGAAGKRVSGWVTYNPATAAGTEGRHMAGDKVYYHKTKGLISGVLKIGSYWYWFDPGTSPGEYGKLWTTEGQTPDGLYYCYSLKGYLRVGKTVNIGGVDMYYGKNGELVSGPVKIGKVLYFYDRTTYERVVPGVSPLVSGVPLIGQAGGWLTENDGFGNTDYYWIQAPDGKLKTGWFTEPGTNNRYYFSTVTGKALKGAQKIGKYYYWFDLTTGELWTTPDQRIYDPINDTYYHCYSANGYLSLNRSVTVSGVEYYHGRDGKVAAGPIKIGSYFFFYDRTSYQRIIPASDYWFTETIGGVDYHYYITEKQGRIRTGMFADNAGIMVYSHPKTGAVFTGQAKVKKLWYCFEGRDGRVTDDERLIYTSGEIARDAIGLPVRGSGGVKAQTAGAGKLYYYKPNGARVSGWVNFTSLTEQNSGGTREAGARAHYTANGISLGPRKVSGAWYFFERVNGLLVRAAAPGVGIAIDGHTPLWIIDGGNKYCTTRTDGRLKTGTKVVSGLKYYFSASGVLYINGERKISNKWYLFDMDGQIVTSSWVNMPDGRRVYFNANGARLAGMNQVAVPGYMEEYWFFFNTANGNMLSGKEQKVGSYYYYFRGAGEESGQVMQSGTLVSGFAAYTGTPVTGPEGSRVKGWWMLTDGAVKYYSESPATEGRRLHSSQLLPLNYLSDPTDEDYMGAPRDGKLYYFMSASTGELRKNAGGNSGEYRYTTDGKGIITSWVHLGKTMKGVDVSYWQGNISLSQWKQVKASGVQFVIARAGYCNVTNSSQPKFYMDSTFINNVTRARAAGLYVGAYIYVYSRNITEQRQMIDSFAAQMQAAGLGPGSLDLPVFLDLEDTTYYYPGTGGAGGNAYRTEMARDGMKRLKSKGYEAGFYTYLSWAGNPGVRAGAFDAKQLEKEGWTFWLARFYANNAELAAYSAPWDDDYPGIWQYRSTGSVPGISGNVDRNWMYTAKVKWT